MDEMDDEQPEEATPEDETPDEGARDEEASSAEAPTFEPSGHADVDEVLSELDRLGELDVHDHVAVFETAHQGLRRALDDGGR